MMPRAQDRLQPQLLNRIAWLLWAMVVAIVLAFCFLASSLCITFVLAAFLSILIDPVVTFFEMHGIPRAVSSAILIIAGVVLCALLAFAAYNGISNVLETVPQYSDRIREFIKPIQRKVERVQQTAGSLSPETPLPKKVQEVAVHQPDSWPSFLVRGVGTVWGAIIIMAIVPFLMYFNLLRKYQMHQRLVGVLSSSIDVSRLVRETTSMVRGYTVGNLLAGSVMAGIIAGMLLILKIDGAITLGIVSGFLNLIPFIGVLLALVATLPAALLQFSSLGPLAIIASTILFLHVIAANYVIPKVIGSRVNIGPVAATLGILFWGWLWGAMGILLAVPLTAFVKIIADCHPALINLSNLLADSPKPVPNWRRLARRADAEAKPESLVAYPSEAQK
jgi:predicted PurR-regulated permease PerM